MENEKIEFKYETLWKLIIRPPRDDYDEELLGDKVFTYQDKTYTRKDYNLVSSQGNILKCSFIEPEEKYRQSLLSGRMNRLWLLQDWCRCRCSVYHFLN